MLLLATAFTVFGGNRPITDPMSSHRWLYRMPLSRTGDFLLGILCAVLFMRFRITLERFVPQWSVVRRVVPVAVLLMLFMGQSAFSWDVAFAIPFALLILSLSLTQESAFARFLASRPMVFAGEVSFAFYLVHVPASQIWNLVHPGTDLTNYFAKMIFIALVASGIHFAIEKPAQRLVKRALTFLSRRPASAGGRATNGVRVR